MAANERPVSSGALHGKWEVVGSEIENWDDRAEFYHFSFDDFWWKIHFKDGQEAIQRFKYRIEDGVIRFKSRSASDFWSLEAFCIEEFLVFRPPHGMESWMKRIGDFGE